MKKLLLLFVLVLTVCSTVKAQEESLTMLSPVGTIGTLDGREAMVVDLGGTIGKVAIATKNVGATNVYDYGTPFSAEDALDSDKNGLTDGWYVPSDLELTLLYPKLDFNKARTGLEWMVTGNSKLTFPGKYYSDEGGRYTGSYVSSSIIEEDEMKKVYAFYFQLDNAITYKNSGNTPSQEDISAIRPFHKLPNTYYTDADGVSHNINAIEVTSSTEPVIWGEAGKETWYVVTGEDVTLSQGAICTGDVRLILADGAKLTAKGAENHAGITVSEAYNQCYRPISLTIYGQAAQSGQLEANGGCYSAGIGGGYEEPGSYITINGGVVTATGGSNTWGFDCGAGIGGGFDGSAEMITINGGTVTANGGDKAPGIGSGIGKDCSYIYINGGTVTANGGFQATGIGCGGWNGKASSIYINGGMVTANGGKDASGIGSGLEGPTPEIYVAVSLIIKADGNNPPTTVVYEKDLASSLTDKRYVTITEPYFNITANQDPDDETHYYSTFYSRTCDYQVPSGVTAYTGAVDGDVLKLTAIEGGIIPAGEAVILRLTSEEGITATMQQFDLTALTTTATKSGTNELTGTDVAKTLSTNDYALSFGQYGVGFYDWSGRTIDAHKAYLTLPGSQLAPGRSFGMKFDDGTFTGIPATIIDQPQDDIIYNLQGQRVDESYKGLIIKNGQKVYNY